MKDVYGADNWAVAEIMGQISGVQQWKSAVKGFVKGVDLGGVVGRATDDDFIEGLERNGEPIVGDGGEAANGSNDFPGAFLGEFPRSEVSFSGWSLRVAGFSYDDFGALLPEDVEPASADYSGDLSSGVLPSLFFRPWDSASSTDPQAATERTKLVGEFAAPQLSWAGSSRLTAGFPREDFDVQLAEYARQAWTADGGDPSQGGLPTAFPAPETSVTSADPLAAIDWGTKLATNIVDYYLAPVGTYIDGVTDFGPALGFTGYQEYQIRLALNEFSKVLDLEFRQTSTQTGAEFRLGAFELDAYNAISFMVPPGESFAGFMGFDPDYLGGVDSTTGDPMLSQGGVVFAILLEELGHGLGLAHMHDDGGTSTIWEGVTAPYGSYGTGDLNQGIYTIMGYNEGWPAGPNGDQYWDGTYYQPAFSYGYQATPMALDIALLQSKYGANTTTGAGDSLYELPVGNGLGTSFKAIWDVGGSDTMRYGGAKDATLDLRAATLLGEPGGGGFVSHAKDVLGGFTISNGTVIENAFGGSGNDTIIGNDAANYLDGGGGNDRLNGDTGVDWLYGGEGSDVLYGDGGWDRLYGDAWSDDLYGGYGNDQLFGGWGDDRLEGGIGDDTLQGEGGNDRLFGGNDLDRLYGGDGNDRLHGDTGADWLYGGEGSDVLYGDGGWDRLYGDAWSDDLYGGDGNDQLFGGWGDDRLEGGIGDDTLQGEGGNDRLFGGNDLDRLYGGDGNDRLHGDTGADWLYGGEGSDVLYGDVGWDRLYGDAWSDDLYGGDGNDQLFGGWGDDRLEGGIGDDTLQGEGGNDRLFGGNDLDRLYGGDGNDRLHGDTGADWLYGGEGSDVLYGGGGWDRLYGDAWSDELYGGDGNDQLFGGWGDDTLEGGAGSDTLEGGNLADTLSGGWGNDVFVFNLDDGNDVISDFEDGLDLIRFSGTGLSFEDLAIFGVGTDAVITGAGLGEIVLSDFDYTMLSEGDFLFV
ncbi:M10 family metallopeptidase C-terminal domain-containing protein [Defluviimonas sp. WL0024]|uniref:M10 family metallopeptidase C-terminal domain-containing protein n=1 Tax=Albidovulum salinarum TaxID=2984153 RepID=A0ABT2WZ87_9RHOB|nr:M10 family metallopeptidase C-terminal domain-containing protein [Defluviimonas sp. WL0024]MCU9846784.1 M10 family metallopeptidase C-terminal domain-containing protein [Defluviimonas sp. WL0024]